MDFIMGLVSKKHQAYNPYSFQSIARDIRPEGALALFEQGPFSLASTQPQVRPGVWRLGPNQECFIEVQWREEDFTLEIQHDSWATKPCFYLEDQEKFIFSSDFYALTKFMGESVEMDSSAISEYLSTGLLTGEKTFFKNVKMLGPQSSLSFDRNKTRIMKHEKSLDELKALSVEDKVQNLVACFEQSVSDWVEYFEVDSANLSGGADTRLVLAALSESDRSRIKFITDASVKLLREDDQDVVIAETLAQKYNLNHIVRDHSVAFKQQGFKSEGAVDRPKLTGHYGGELLGLEALTALHFFFEPAASVPEEQVNALLNLKQENRIQTKPDASFEFGVRAFFHSFFTDIYDGGILNDWSMPHQFIKRKASPFWNSKLIDYILSLSDDFPRPYDLYAHIYRNYYPEFMQVPFASVITRDHADFRQLDRGVDQKETFLEEAGKKDFVLLSKQNVRLGVFDPEAFETLLKEDQDSLLQKRCLKLNRWMEDIGLQAKRESWPLRLLSSFGRVFTQED